MFDSFLFHCLEISLFQAYLILFIGILVEGDISLFASGYLASLGIFQKELVLFLAILAAAIADLFCYFFGRNIDLFPEKINKGVAKLAGRFDQALKEKTFLTIFFGKFFYGFHFLLLVRAGTLQIPFRKFIRVDGFSAILWILIIFSFGFFSGASFFVIKDYIKFSEIGILIGIIIFFSIRKLFSHYLKNKLDIKK